MIKTTINLTISYISQDWKNFSHGTCEFCFQKLPQQLTIIHSVLTK